MNFFNQILGRTKPTSVNVTKLLSEAGADLEANRKQFAEAEAALQRVAVMTADEHAAADTKHAEARRAIVRLEAQIVELQKGLAEAQETERLEALKARAEAAKQRVTIEAPKVLDRYEANTRAIAEAVSELQAIDAEVEIVNADLRKAGLDPIETVENRYRREPDRVIPEVRKTSKKWVRRTRWGGEETVSITTERDGRQLPTDGHGNIIGDAYEVEVEHVTPAQTKPGRRLDSLAGGVRLPPARIGSAWHWPKG